MRNSPSTQRKRDDHGVVAIEFVFVAPFLFFFILIIAQFGFYFSKKVDVNDAARDAARTFALGATPTYPTGMTLDPDPAFGPAPAPCAVGNTGNVSVHLIASYTFDLGILPISLGTKTIKEAGTMRCGG